MKLRIISFLAAALLAPAVLHGQARDDQFKKDAFSQNYADTSKQQKPDSSQLFSFRQYFGSLAHKRPGNVQNLFIGSTVFVGGGQIYNRQYWKLPVVYGGIGAGVGLGIHFNNQYKATGDEKFKQYSTWSYIGAGLVWWGSLMDMTANFKSDRHPEPGKSTLYSVLLPGLGQVYNGEYWKVPIYLGGMATFAYFYQDFRRNYLRYKWLYDLNTMENPEVTPPPEIDANKSLVYRNQFRRYRDYALLGIGLMYVLQIVDANVFAYMQDFEMNDDISLRLEPTLITPEFAAAPPAPGVGLTLRF